MSEVGYGTVLAELADQEPDSTALVCGAQQVTRRQLDRQTNRIAHAYAALGIGSGDLISIALPNGFDLVRHAIAAWKIGAVPNPLSHRVPRPELDAILKRAHPELLVADMETSADYRRISAAWQPDASVSDSPLPDIVSPNERALATGGSTGTPKLIVIQSPAAHDPSRPKSVIAPKGTVLVPGPLYHAAPFGSLTQALLAGVEVVIMERFDAAECLSLIERHKVEQILFVPTMMHRIWRLPETQRLQHDTSSLRLVFTGGAPCPEWLMRRWIEWLGPDVMHELYGPSERIGGTHITGHEWLQHPGSVGKATAGAAIKILDPQTQSEMAAGEIGEVFMMPSGGRGSTYRYVGAESRTTRDGFESVGDMGHLDADGYLYLADRRSDMILCGGRNIYPAQIEAALDEHPQVKSSAVIGLPDDDLGQRIHAIIECDEPIEGDGLREHLEARIARYSIPRTFEYVGEPLRDEAGKVRRYKLRQERLHASS